MDISMIYRIFAVNSLERYMADFNEKIYKGLLEGNDIIIQKFFNGKFKSVLEKIIDRVFKGVSFESARAQLFNDLYVYLTENDAKRLRLYETEGNGDIIVWLAEMATKYYLNERNKHRKKQKRHFHRKKYDQRIQSANQTSSHQPYFFYPRLITASKYLSRNVKQHTSGYNILQNQHLTVYNHITPTTFLIRISYYLF